MKVIKRGSTLEEKFLEDEHFCPHCHTVFKVEKGDSYTVSPEYQIFGYIEGTSNTAYVTTDCPVCHQLYYWHEQGKKIPSQKELFPYIPTIPYIPPYFTPYIYPLIPPYVPKIKWASSSTSDGPLRGDIPLGRGTTY